MFLSIATAETVQGIILEDHTGSSGLSAADAIPRWSLESGCSDPTIGLAAGESKGL
jgi:hypothetical protein